MSSAQLFHIESYPVNLLSVQIVYNRFYAGTSKKTITGNYSLTFWEIKQSSL